MPPAEHNPRIYAITYDATFYRVFNKLAFRGGNFKIENVPHGKYKVVAWHEGMKTQTKPVDVACTGKVEFTLSQ